MTTSDNTYVVFAWDHRNRRVSATSYNASNVVQTAQIYRYNNDNLRVGKDTKTVSTSTCTDSETYVYDGTQMVLAFDQDGKGARNRIERASAITAPRWCSPSTRRSRVKDEGFRASGGFGGYFDSHLSNPGHLATVSEPGSLAMFGLVAVGCCRAPPERKEPRRRPRRWVTLFCGSHRSVWPAIDQLVQTGDMTCRRPRTFTWHG